MPTDEEIFSRASQYASSGTIGDGPWSDGAAFTNGDRRTLTNMGNYIRDFISGRTADRRKAQRRAMVLLRSLLTPTQRQTLRTSKDFMAVGSGGNVYRFYPRMGTVWRVERHGRNWFAKLGYCIHEDKETGIPPADRTVAHLLMLLTDEEEFVRTANATPTGSQMWNGEYLRSMRQRRLTPQHQGTNP